MPSGAAVAALLCVGGTLLSVLLRLPVGTAQALPPQPQPSGGSEECPRICGDVNIPYPFGFGPDEHCYRPGFRLDCKATEEDGIQSQRPFKANAEVLGISLHTGQARVMHHISSYCYDDTELHPGVRYHWDLSRTPYSFSDPGNRFIVIGCRTLAYIKDQRSRGNDVKSYMTGCVSFWPGAGGVGTTAYASNDSCSGMGCCQTAIPMGLQYYQVSFDTRFVESEVVASCNCSYAVLMDPSNFTFSPSYLTTTEFNDTYNGRAPMLLQWSIGTQNCDAARTNSNEDFACVSDNSECFDAPRGQGYICNQALPHSAWAGHLASGVTLNIIVQAAQLFDAIENISLQDHPDSFSWRLSSDGSYSSATAYGAMFLGSSIPLGAKQIWQTAAPPRVRFFLWLVLHRRCWTAERRFNHGLQDSPLCILCDQENESIDHLLLGCAYSREVWQRIFMRLQLPHLLPRVDDLIFPWWLQSRKAVPKARRKGFDSLFSLGCWKIWKERNRRTFDAVLTTPVILANEIMEEARLWSLAGNSRIRGLLPG